MELDFTIKNDMLILEKQKEVLSGNVNFYKCKFNILTNKDLIWICVFKKDDKAYQQVVENNQCLIPQEVLFGDGKLEIGCYATSNTEDFKRISTNWILLEISNGAYMEATAPEIPKKDVWETLILKNVPIIGENGNWYMFDTEKKEYVDSGKTSIGEKGDRGETGLPGTTNAANALIGRKIGQRVVIDDVSPVEHTVDAKVMSKNIISTFVVRDASASGIAVSVRMNLKKGKTYVFSYNTENTGARMWYVNQNAYIKYIANAGTKTCDGTRHYAVFTALQDCTNRTFSVLQATDTTPANTGLCSNIMIEEGNVATEYTPYVEDVSNILVEISDENGRFEEMYSSQDGTLQNVVASYPSMNFLVMSPNAVVDVTYNRDINKAFQSMEEKFTNAIISLGGNV